MELDHPVGQGLGSSVFLIRNTAHTQIALRTSLVFSPAPGNIFAVLSRLVRFGLGGTQGSGRQYVSWIHESDFARSLEFLIEHEQLDGPINLAAPNPLPNRDFMAALRDAWNVPNGIPAPAPLIALGACSFCAPSLSWCSKAAASFRENSSMQASASSFPSGPKPPMTSCANGVKETIEDSAQQSAMLL
jgi:nucleoside-diphosphate-sugar epimerase